MNLGVVGGLGLMASPMAKHWKGSENVFIPRVHDRGSSGAHRDKCRKAWDHFGAARVSSLKELVGNNDIDGVIVCCGKNEDDRPIIGELAQLMSSANSQKFICHMSTVSVGFANAASTYCADKKVNYVNYPLTGGNVGAEKGTMLILAGGDESLFETLLPSLSEIGTPRHFGSSSSAGTEVKLIGHLMVFNGLMGICSAVSTHAECFNQGKIGGEDQVQFFDFLNSGAGGTKQWEIILKLGIENDIWKDKPFAIRYAVVDAVYAVQMCLERKVSRLVVDSLINVSLAFSYLMNHLDPSLATHAIVREMISSRRDELDAFCLKHSGPREDLNLCLEKCVSSLPQEIKKIVGLNITRDDFENYSGSRNPA